MRKIKMIAYYTEYIAAIAKYVSECAKNFPVLPEKPEINE